MRARPLKHSSSTREADQQLHETEPRLPSAVDVSRLRTVTSTASCWPAAGPTAVARTVMNFAAAAPGLFATAQRTTTSAFESSWNPATSASRSPPFSSSSYGVEPQQLHALHGECARGAQVAGGGVLLRGEDEQRCQGDHRDRDQEQRDHHLDQGEPGGAHLGSGRPVRAVPVPDLDAARGVHRDAAERAAPW